jgi:Flp pilus assembly protein TadD
MRVLRGEILLARGADKEAAGYFNALIEGEAGSVEAYLGVGEALMRSKRYGDAETTLGKGLKSHADDDRLLFARGTALERLGDFEQAERALSRAVTVNPENAMALNYLGYMLADQGIRLADSVSFVERALSLDPENPAYLDSLGWALFKLERYAPAEEKLRAALRYDAADPAIREHLGDLLLATGREEEAVREWEAALKCGHEDPERIREKMAKAQERKKSAR